MVSRLQLELGFAAFLLLVGAVGLLGGRELEAGWASDGPQAGFFPFRVALILCAAAVLVAVQAWRARAMLAPTEALGREGGQRVLGFFLPIVAAVAVAQWLGLYVAMAAYLLGAIRLAGKPWRVAAGVALGVTLVLFVVFEFWFQVPLKKGPLEIWLGLA